MYNNCYYIRVRYNDKMMSVIIIINNDNEDDDDNNHEDHRSAAHYVVCTRRRREGFTTEQEIVCGRHHRGEYEKTPRQVREVAAADTRVVAARAREVIAARAREVIAASKGRTSHQLTLLSHCDINRYFFKVCFIFRLNYLPRTSITSQPCTYTHTLPHMRSRYC